MALYIDAVEGPNSGESFVIQAGYVIGRKQGEVRISDSKVSARHAIIAAQADGEGLVLTDLGSSNGIRLNGERVKSLPLTPGTRFQMGRNTYLVRDGDQKADLAMAPESVLENLDETPKTWDEMLLSRLKVHSEKVQNIQKGLEAFMPALKLEFLEGIQADQSLILGYGPRTAGAQSEDIPLLEPHCPDMAFRLRALDSSKVEFINLAPNVIHINGHGMSTKELEDGDMISLGDTKIRVTFVGES